MNPEEKDNGTTTKTGGETNQGATPPTDNGEEGTKETNIPPKKEGKDKANTPPADKGKGKADEKAAEGKGTGNKAGEESAASATESYSAQKRAAAKQELEMMDKLKVKTLFKNSKGEYFTVENLAHLSETKKENIKTVNRAELIAVANTAE
ncbi:hypothetical protein [Williamwhitmania taraxaci]|uniref:Uncharacterized protein n=1 Tax=Williamwhitmania taraxaci TaxID=1640674 RepID=A0A1G6MB52_9BACT|nr:hypothetical protein [Williamwhitmania taraxaci]SDC52743.1 hypothetical protein SAMN05216323_103524 [Williamwhitmania taraxaci]